MTPMNDQYSTFSPSNIPVPLSSGFEDVSISANMTDGFHWVRISVDGPGYSNETDMIVGEFGRSVPRARFRGFLSVSNNDLGFFDATFTS